MTSLSIQAYLHPRNIWILVPLQVGDRALAMVLDTGSPLSSVSEGVLETLLLEGHVESAARPAYVIRNATIQGQPIPDLPVRVSRRVTQVGADGVLGLNFFGQFTEAHCHIPSLRFTLSSP